MFPSRLLRLSALFLVACAGSVATAAENNKLPAATLAAVAWRPWVASARQSPSVWQWGFSAVGVTGPVVAHCCQRVAEAITTAMPR